MLLINTKIIESNFKAFLWYSHSSQYMAEQQQGRDWCYGGRIVNISFTLLLSITNLKIT